jgi:hypothetical protein
MTFGQNADIGKTNIKLSENSKYEHKTDCISLAKVFCCTCKTVSDFAVSLIRSVILEAIYGQI